MNLWGTGQDLFRSAENSLADSFEFLAHMFAGPASDLRDGTEHDPVSLPRDLAAHSDAQTEWWYYTGHAQTASGRRFGFELVFFKRRTDLDKFKIVPLRLIGNPFYFAHFAISDIDSKKFRYAHRKSSNGPLDLDAAASEKAYFLKLGDWHVYESNGVHVLRASLDDGTEFSATASPAKPVVLNGENGVSFKDTGEASRYFAYTRMKLDGIIGDRNGVERFSGSAWMDREFGTWKPTDNQKGWDWFSIQFDGGQELMCYQLRNSLGEPTQFSNGRFVDENGEHTQLSAEDFEITGLARWKSPRSDADYPSKWRIAVPRFDISIIVEPYIADQELDTRGTTMIVYWEGACSVSGSCKGSSASGNAYVELVGYDRSHESPDLSTFLIGGPFERIFGLGTK